MVKSPIAPSSKTKQLDLERAIRGRHYLKIIRVPVGVRVSVIRSGLPATLVKEIASHMAVPQERLYSTLGLARATLIRKLKKQERMKPDESERVLGLATLIGQVQNMVERSGDPTGFDAARWVAQWLEQPLPALGGKPPGEWMDTSEGQRLVADTLARMESGAYA